MSVATIVPVGPTRRAAARVWPPAPAATSSTRAPALTPAASSMRSVAGPSQPSSVGPQRCQASAASSHCCRVVVLYWTGSKPIGSSWSRKKVFEPMGARSPADRGRFDLALRQTTTAGREATMGAVSESSGVGSGMAASLVGREQLLNRPGGLVGLPLAGERVTVMVTGEGGVGKTSLLRAAVAVAGGRGVRIGWGTCLDVTGAPGYWPWTQALDGLVRGIGTDQARRLSGDDAPLLATIVPALGAPAPGELTDRARLLLFDAVSRLLDSLASGRGLIVVLDDLHWADASSLALFDFVARAGDRSGVCLIGAYRHNELDAPARDLLGALVSHSEHVPVEGIDADATQELVARLTGRTVDRATANAIHRRTGGHPFFVREIALHADHADGDVEHIPAAVRDVIERRMARLPEPTRALLEVAAIMGAALRPDVAARALDTSPLAVEVAARGAVVAGVLTPTGDGLRFAHDLLRETILDRLEASRRVALHRAIGGALEERAARTAPVAPAELARHFIAAIPLDGPERALRWALRAATADCEALAFAEAAAHLRRLRAALAEAAVDVADKALFEILVAEADALARAGTTLDARGLLRAACDVADRMGDPDRTASVALAT